MQKFGLIIDSTTVLEEEFIKKFDIEIVSLSVTIDQDTYREVDVDDEFVKNRLEKAKKMHSSAPSPGDFLSAYKRLIAKGFDEIVVLPISSGLSSTYQSAVMGIDLLDRNDIQIFVIDSNMCNVGHTNVLHTFFAEIEEGLSASEFVEEIKIRLTNTRLQFTVQDLKQLYMTGRLRRLMLIAAEILRIKPVIEMKDGKLENVAKPRATRAVFDVFINKIKEIYVANKKLLVSVVSLGHNALVEPLVQRIKETFANVKIMILEKVNPVFVLSLGNKGIGFSATAY